MEDTRVDTREQWKPEAYRLASSRESEEVLLIMDRV